MFRSDADADLEGVYIFPIPENASISKFSMWMNGKEVEGEVLDAQKARKIYEDIVRRRRDPGLLEYCGRDMFRARVYPIPRRGEVRIEIAYEEHLKYDSGLIEYRYPLKTDHSFSKKLDEVSIAVEVHSNVPIKNLYSPTHEIDARIEGRKAHCGYEEKNVRPDKDFLLYYAVSEAEFGFNLLTHRPPGEDGFFMLLISPGRVEKSEEVLSKDIVFAIDKSGSMQGEKIVQAKNALKYCLQSLNPGDRFNIVAFSTGVNSFSKDIVPVSKANLKRALAFVDDLEARGGTDIDGALQTALTGPPSQRPQMIVFLTDGRPTVGTTSIEEILSSAEKKNHGRMRIFTFGVGYDVNTHLLDRLSSDNRGAADYVRPEEDIEVKVSNFYNKVSNPVLSDLALDFQKITTDDLFPNRLPDMFAGSQLVVFGRYRGDGAAAIGLSGRMSGGNRKFDYEYRFPKVRRENDFIPRLWASRKIAYLMAEIRSRGENKELVDEVIHLSLEYGILTPYTSYLILEEGAGVVSQHVVDMLRDSAAPMAPEMKGFANVIRTNRKVGRGAVDLSRSLAAAKEVTVVEDPRIDGFRFVGGRAFLYADGGWKDAGYKEGMKTIDIKYLSNEYFALLREKPEVARYLSLGENVLFVYDGVAYKVTARKG